MELNTVIVWFDIGPFSCRMKAGLYTPRVAYLVRTIRIARAISVAYTFPGFSAHFRIRQNFAAYKLNSRRYRLVGARPPSAKFRKDRI
jgi:hypothetical protein